jgi:hypothetical protein
MDRERRDRKKTRKEKTNRRLKLITGRKKIFKTERNKSSIKGER